ncbi:MAG TPA: hypothetical protein VN249_03040, partial [Prolixibacteraceae bacterium]|nr:hypothetical protein [Prolixibacteraceae bacterium]
MMEYTPPLQFRIRQSFIRYISLCLVLTGLILLVRLYEILFISGAAGYPSGSFSELIFGVRFDLLLSFRLSGYLLIPFLLIDHYSPKTARVFFAAVSVIVILTEISLLRYFAATRMPLGSDILGYSLSEIKQTVGASGEVNIIAIIPAVVFFVFTVFAFYKWSRIEVSRTLLVFFSVFMFSAMLPLYNFNPDPIEYRNEFTMNIAANKLNFFGESLLNHFRHSKGPGNFVLNANDSEKSETDQISTEPAGASVQNQLASNADLPSGSDVKLLQQPESNPVN